MLRLRDAEPSDVPDIFTMIRELAAYERLLEEMVGSSADLRRHLFGEPRYARALMAQWGDQTAGFALYFFNYSTFRCLPGLYLEDLFVRPAFRGHGVGLALLQALEQRAGAAGCGRLEWSVLDWNQSAIDFYRRFGAVPRPGWTLYRKQLPGAPG
jgi:GNAT superfamily N-acetyltransferase